MNRTISVKWVIITMSIAGLLSICMAGSPLQKHEALAEKLVNQCANVQENDNVLISGSVRDADLMDEIAVQVTKAGAYPLVTLASQQRDRRYFDIIPEKYDSREPALDLALTQLMQVHISIDYGEEFGLFKDVPSERFAAINEAYKVVSDLYQQNNIRAVNLGNGLYPTEPLAQRFGISIEELTDLFWKGIDTDYAALEKTGLAVKKILENSKTLRVTNPEGTDITFAIAAKEAIVSDGMISDEEMEQGFPYCQVWLPAGEVFTAVKPGSAEGTIVMKRIFFQGTEIEMLKLTFKNGKLISMSAKSDIKAYKDRYEAAGEGKEMLSVVDIGINPAIMIPPGSKMVSWMSEGMVTLGTGNNQWAGGDNDVMFSLIFNLADATLVIDGKKIVKQGRLQL